MTDFLTTTPHQDEVFTDPVILGQALNVIRNSVEEAVLVRVSALWDRKEQLQSGPLNADSVYRTRNGTDSIQVTITVNIPSWEHNTSPTQELISAVKDEIEDRLDERAEQKKAETAARIAELQAELDRLNEAE